MTRFLFIHIYYYIYLIALVIITSLSSCSKKDISLVEGVNIVLILTDDQGWGDVGFNGNVTIETPLIDSVAEQSVVFNRFYVSPVCAPTRASLLTGKYHLATGTSWVTHRKEVMRSSEVTLAEILQSHGYKTACFGKWHNGAQYPHNPNGQGFDSFFGFSAGHWNNYFDTQLEYNGKMVQTKGYLPNVLTDSVVSFIGRNANSPFFAYVAYNTPHTPYQVPDKYFNKYKNKGLDDKTACIYGMNENIDDNIERIFQELDNKNLSENTIFIFMSDNGPNYLRYNGGFKGRKAQVDEGGIRVPFLLHYPNGEFPASVVDNMVAHIDVLPTILDICNISLNDSLVIDGISFKPLLENKVNELPDRYFYTHHVMREFDTFPGAIRTDKHLLTITPTDTSLYNLQTDPFQKVDISYRAPYTTERLLLEYKKWFCEVTKNGIKPEPIHINSDSNHTTLLPSHEAYLSGGTTFYGKDGWANDWSVGNGKLAWNIKVNQEGKYKVTALYSGSESNTTIKIRCGKQNRLVPIKEVKVAPIIPSNDWVTRDEVYERAWHKIDLGEIYLIPGDTNLKLEVRNPKKQAQTEIKSIIIKRI